MTFVFQFASLIIISTADDLLDRRSQDDSLESVSRDIILREVEEGELTCSNCAV